MISTCLLFPFALSMGETKGSGCVLLSRELFNRKTARTNEQKKAGDIARLYSGVHSKLRNVKLKTYPKIIA